MVKKVSTINDSDLIVVTIPVDIGTKRRWGQKLGARKFRELLLSSNEDLNVFDYGELFVNNFKLQETHQIIFNETKKLMKEGKFLLFLGGDHSITYGICKAFKNSMIYSFDAHPDLVKEDLITCQSWLYHYKNRSKLIGVRWFTKQEEKDMSQLKSNRSKNAHITIDVDCMDPSLVPGVAYLTEKGLSLKDFEKNIKKIFKSHNVLSLDFNEYCPIIEQEISQKNIKKMFNITLKKIKEQMKKKLL